ncbi:Formate efflux transporter FocA [Olavius algarvensis Delta 1 endosymbiont]|nr:Formate efflux transporter FocA [Olavius algarvensis Delta 1 endosymbiont]
MSYKPPYEIVKAANQAGLVKARMGLAKTLLMGFLAGAFIAFGGFLAIMTFVALGFEHSVANMFFIPLGILYGAHVSWYQFFMINLIPVTLGNIVGGSFFVGTIYWIVYEYKTQEKLSL